MNFNENNKKDNGYDIKIGEKYKKNIVVFRNGSHSTHPIFKFYNINSKP